MIDLEEPPLQAETIMSSSITASLILAGQQLKCTRARGTNFGLPLCTMKTSLSRTDVSTRHQHSSKTGLEETNVCEPMSRHWQTC